MEHLVGCFGRAQYYRSTREAVLVQQSTIGALESLGWYSRVLVGCVGTEEYYRRTVEVVSVQQSTIGATERLCWYSRVLYDDTGGCVVTAEYYRRTRLRCAGTEEYYRSSLEAVLIQKSSIEALGRLGWYRRVL